MNRKLLVVVPLIILAVVVVGVVMAFGFGREPHSTENEPLQPSPQTVRPTDALRTSKDKLTAEAANKMVAKLVSRDPVVYKSAWAHSNVPPVAPKGTKVTINGDSLRSHGTLGQIDITVTMPGKNLVKVTMYVEFIAGQWRIHYMEEVK